MGLPRTNSNNVIVWAWPYLISYFHRQAQIGYSLTLPEKLMTLSTLIVITIDWLVKIQSAQQSDV